MSDNNWEQVGYCGVDSGQITLVDPCYVLRDPGTSQNENITYNDLLRESEQSNWPQGQEVVFKKPYGNGVNISGFGGDGNYPVYVKKNSAGLVIEAKIVFNEEE